MSINKYVLVPYAKYQTLIGSKGAHTNSDCIITQESTQHQQGAGSQEDKTDKKNKEALTTSPPPGLPDSFVERLKDDHSEKQSTLIGAYSGQESLNDSDSDSFIPDESWRDNWISLL